MSHRDRAPANTPGSSVEDILAGQKRVSKSASRKTGECKKTKSTGKTIRCKPGKRHGEKTKRQSNNGKVKGKYVLASNDCELNDSVYQSFLKTSNEAKRGIHVVDLEGSSLDSEDSSEEYSGFPSQMGKRGDDIDALILKEEKRLRLLTLRAENEKLEQEVGRKNSGVNWQGMQGGTNANLNELRSMRGLVDSVEEELATLPWGRERTDTTGGEVRYV